MTKADILKFLREARRRKVYTTAVAYAAVSIGLIELGGAIFDALNMPDWAPNLLTLLLLLGFPIVLVLAWIFDLGASGIQRTGSSAASLDPTVAAPGLGWSGGFVTAQPELPRQIEVVEEAPDPDRVWRASLAFVRHELRTPVNAIIGYSEMLLEDAQDEGDAEAATDLERINRGGREILAVVDTTLDASRISEEQHRDLASYGEQIRADLRDPLSAVTGYTEMLIESSREQDRTSRLPDLERMLAAARKLLDLSNDIAALATHTPDAAPAEMAKAATLAEGTLAKIRAVRVQHTEPDRHGSLLVVDDNAMNRDLLAKQLARKGYFVTTAESGNEALERMAQETFDLVLLDVLMPDLDGVGVLMRMKNDPRLRAVPVIMISALDEIDSVVRCLEIGAADFVSKPFHATLLDARINATLTAHASRGRNGAVPGPDGAAGKLLAGIVPNYVVQRLRAGETRLLDGTASAAVYFVDIDHAVASTDPTQRATLTEKLIETAQRVAATEGTTILLQGIGLVMTAGFPEPQADAAQKIARAALAFATDAQNAGVRVRSAIHVGALYAAVVGHERLSYWIWGEAVELSRRLALGAERGRIVVSPAGYAILKERFHLVSKGVVELAGHGQLRAYVLEAEGAIAR